MTDKKADAAMQEIWQRWFEFYTNHFRGNGIAISTADRMAFCEIAQPILRKLAQEGTRTITDAEIAGRAIWERQKSLCDDRDGISTRLKWRSPLAHDRVWDGYVLDAQAALATLEPQYAAERQVAEAREAFVKIKQFAWKEGPPHQGIKAIAHAWLKANGGEGE